MWVFVCSCLFVGTCKALRWNSEHVLFRIVTCMGNSTHALRWQNDALLAWLDIKYGSQSWWVFPGSLGEGGRNVSAKHLWHTGGREANVSPVLLWQGDKKHKQRRDLCGRLNHSRARRWLRGGKKEREGERKMTSFHYALHGHIHEVRVREKHNAMDKNIESPFTAGRLFFFCFTQAIFEKLENFYKMSASWVSFLYERGHNSKTFFFSFALRAIHDKVFFKK